MARSDEEDELYLQIQESARKELAEGREQLRRGFEAFETVIGAKIKQLREERHWSQSQLAERLGELGFDLHQTTIAKMESGRRPLRVSEAVAVAQVFGLPAPTLFYIPVQGEPRAMEFMREMVQDAQEALEVTRRLMLSSLDTMANVYAEQTATLHWRSAAMNNPTVDVIGVGHPSALLGENIGAVGQPVTSQEPEVDR